MQTETLTPGQPLVSVIMANYRAGERIIAALRSVLDQTINNIEVIVSDDCSDDSSIAHVRSLMAADPRVRLLQADQNEGPASCRNRALDAARGQWIAIVDSDDIIHPERFERLLAAAAYVHADIIADDLLLFFEDGSEPRLMLADDQDTMFEVKPRQWILSGVHGSPPLGYLKPLIRTDVLRDRRYDEKLRIGEDYDLLLRLLLDGAGMFVLPEPYYLYRRHNGSISHRLKPSDLRAMIDQQVALTRRITDLPPELSSAFTARLSQLRSGLSYEELVASLKARRLPTALSLLARNPAHLRRLHRSFQEGRRRPAPSTPRMVAPGERTCTLAEHVVSGSDAAMVPGYVPVGMTDWLAPRKRRIWRDLAALHRSGSVQCICLDQAGRYAAGFIPEARIKFTAPLADPVRRAS
jgi:succinoglycan biosynthesis protein ExoO